MAASTLIPASTNAKGSKYTLGDKVYLYNIGVQYPLIRDFVVVGIVNNDDGIYYTPDKNMWTKEEFLYKSRKEAYRSLIMQAENEMNSPEVK